MQNQIFTRSIMFDNTSIKDENERIIEVSFSSEMPVVRGGMFEDEWVEILGHKNNEVDLSRLNSKAPALYNHNRFNMDNRIGVVEKAWLDDGRGKAILKISKRKEVDGIWQDIKDGILSNISVGYQINKKEETGKRNQSGILEYRVTKWTPFEISLVDIPADYSVGVGRQSNYEQFLNIINKKGKKMTDNKNQEIELENSVSETNKSTNNENDNLSNVNKESSQEEKRIFKINDKDENSNLKESLKLEFMQKENLRKEEIKKIFEPFKQEQKDLMHSCLEDMNITPEQSRVMLLNELGKNKISLNNVGLPSNAKTQAEKFREFAQDALEFRIGLKTAEETKNNDLRATSLVDIAKICLENVGVNTRGLDKREIVGRAFTHSTSDFPLILSNTTNKSLLKGYEETEEVFEKFTSKTSLSDFKVHERFGTSGFGSLEKVKEGGKYKYGTITERKEDIRLETFGKMFSITRQAIINDDLNAFSDIPRKMGRAAKRTVANAVFDILLSGQVMSDGYQLFHTAKHNNLYDGSGNGGLPSIDLISKMKSDMRKHKEALTKEPLNIKPKFILVPTILEDSTRVLLTSETDPTQNNSKVPNPIRNILEIITDPRLDDNSLTAWYLLSDPNIHDMLEVAYLDGNSNPLLEEQQGWDVDGIEYKIRLDFGVKATDWRTMAKNTGLSS